MESSEPTAGFGAWVFVQQDGEWLLDEFLPMCFGECDRFWELRPGANLLGTPEPASTTAACQYAKTFIPDYEVRADVPINLWPGPGVQSGNAIAAMPGGSPLMFLRESTLSTNPEIDDLHEDQVWMKMRTESGEEGWVREVDVEPRAWRTPVPTPTIVPTTEIEPLSVSTSVPIDDDVQVDPTPSSTMPPEIEPIDVNPTPAR